MTGSEAVEPAAQGALSAEHLRGLGMFLSKELKRTRPRHSQSPYGCSDPMDLKEPGTGRVWGWLLHPNRAGDCRYR